MRNHSSGNYIFAESLQLEGCRRENVPEIGSISVGDARFSALMQNSIFPLQYCPSSIEVYTVPVCCYNFKKCTGKDNYKLETQTQFGCKYQYHTVISSHMAHWKL